MRSRLLLAKNMNGDVLTAAEVFGKQLPQTRLVVLSACETELEEYDNSEGMIGMARTFLAAGAPLVIASQWSINSNATADLMIRFYRHLKTPGMSKSQALRLAQLETINDNGFPFFWAPFVLIGKP